MYAARGSHSTIKSCKSEVQRFCEMEIHGVMRRKMVPRRKISHMGHFERKLMRFQIKRAKQAQRVAHARRTETFATITSCPHQPGGYFYMPKSGDNAGVAINRIFEDKQRICGLHFTFREKPGQRNVCVQNKAH